MSRFRPEFSYANVMATIAVFIALGGASYAAVKLPKNSVGTKQLKKHAVTTAKIKNAAVSGAKVKEKTLAGRHLVDGTITGAKLADGAVTGAKLADGSISGADIDPSFLTSLRASGALGVSLNADCTAAVPFPTGVSAAIAGPGCLVTFPFSVLNCTASATVGFRTDNILIANERTAQTLRKPSAPTQIGTLAFNGGVLIPQPVDLTLVC